MSNTTDIRKEIEALRAMKMPEYISAFDELRERLLSNGELDKYEKHLADVEHQAQRKKHEYAVQDFYRRYENGEFQR